jgi:hypothetical protein
MNRCVLPAMKRVETRKTANPWAAFEQAKKELPPNLTPQEYTAACAAIAKRLGL